MIVYGERALTEQGARALLNLPYHSADMSVEAKSAPSPLGPASAAGSAS